MRRATRFARAEVRISIVVTMACGWIVCRVSDDGSSAPTLEPGLGTQIVDALTADLKGDVERMYTESGTVVTLSFPENLGPASEANYIGKIGHFLIHKARLHHVR